MKINLRFKGAAVIAVICAALALRPNIPEKNIAYFSQADERWKDDRLGKSSFDMESSGCLVSCIASAVIMQKIKINGLKQINPHTLNMLFSENDVYDSDGNIIWERMENILGVSAVRSCSADLRQIKTLIDSGKHPIIRAEANHYVTAGGLKNGVLMCIDPSDGKEIPLKGQIYDIIYIDEKSGR